MTKARKISIGAGSALAALLVGAADARADVVLGGELDYLGTVSVDDDTAVSTQGGFGWGLRGGYEFDLALLYLRPEVGATFGAFEQHTDTRLYGGARLGFQTLISPAIYGHLGHGWYKPTSASVDGFTYDVGGALDLRLPLVSVGAHVGLEVNPDVTPAWVNAGAHVELRF